MNNSFKSANILTNNLYLHLSTSNHSAIRYLITTISIFCYSDLKRDKVKFCLFAPFSGGVRDICGSQVPIIHSTGLLAPPAGVYVGNRFIFMFMLTPSVFVSNRFIVYVDVQFTKSA